MALIFEPRSELYGICDKALGIFLRGPRKHAELHPVVAQINRLVRGHFSVDIAMLGFAKVNLFGLFGEPRADMLKVLFNLTPNGACQAH